ncbi:hypothetical protein ABBQ32_002351 [Trebouxia sp. C0010 RCD-2024]
MAQKDLQPLGQQSSLLHSVLRTISNVMPATPAQHDRWQADGSQGSAHRPAFEPQEVLEQVQSFMLHVEEQRQRWQGEEEDHRHQLSALRLAQEALAGRLSHEEERSTAAEGEVTRQKACIGGLRADAAELEDALHRAKAQVQDAKAAQGTAEAIAAACQRELSQVSSSLASQLEAESMWQGRAQGLHQQLDQAMQEQLQLQQGMARVEAAVGEGQHRIRCTCPLARVRALVKAPVTNTRISEAGI